MKFFAPILLAFAASSQAAFCNAGWGLPREARCPSGYTNSYCCQEPGSPTPTFPTFRTCVNPSSTVGGPSLTSCNGNGIIRCCP